MQPVESYYLETIQDDGQSIDDGNQIRSNQIVREG